MAKYTAKRGNRYITVYAKNGREAIRLLKEGFKIFKAVGYKGKAVCTNR